MLGGLAVLAMLGGTFAAAGAIFDWEFLFSDGRHPHGWVASMGRAAARTLLGLAGGGLLAGGFVARVIAVANTPAATASLNHEMTDAPLDATGDTSNATKVKSEGAPASTSVGSRLPVRPSKPSTTPAQARPTPGPSGSQRQPADDAPPPAASPAQAVTLWHPTATLEPAGTTLFTVNYRFEAGHRARPSDNYLWVIDLSDKTHLVEYGGGVLQQEGQLQHVIQTPAQLANGVGSWSTTLQLGDETGPQIANRLTIGGDGRVQSEPLD